MDEDNYKAKVFISCGQKDDEEKEIANQISDRIRLLGFIPYVAVQQQTLNGLKENIFTNIETSEYFIFLDFKREKLESGQNRGSLFSHQELALASYLKIPCITFQEEGIKRDDGLIWYLQSNCVQFKSRKNLINMVVERIKREKWDPRWKNQLKIILDRNNLFVDVMDVTSTNLGRYYHFKVNNSHRSKSALNCFAYLESITEVVSRQQFTFEHSELKWKGYPFPSLLIPPRSFRKVDAFWIEHKSPKIMNFNVFSDYGGNIPKIIGPNMVELMYMIVSENFPIIKSKITVKIGSNIEDINVSIRKIR
jgi:hypothetical protein